MMTPVRFPPAVTVVVAQDVNSEYETADAELSELFRSAELALALALRGYPPGVVGWATTETVAVPLFAIAPRLQLIVVVPVQADP